MGSYVFSSACIWPPISSDDNIGRGAEFQNRSHRTSARAAMMWNQVESGRTSVNCRPFFDNRGLSIVVFADGTDPLFIHRSPSVWVHTGVRSSGPFAISEYSSPGLAHDSV